jgi:6-phosphogluconolactonase
MNWQLFIGCYTQRLPYVDGKGRGIYSLEMDALTGALQAPRLAHPSTNPSFLALHPGKLAGLPAGKLAGLPAGKLAGLPAGEPAGLPAGEPAGGRWLYAVNELERLRGRPAGGVSAYEIGAGGALRKLNQRSTGGGAPCHICLDAGGGSLLVANYTGGSLARLPVGQDGRLGKASQILSHHGCGPNPARQEAAHVHSSSFDPGQRWLLAADLGIDQVAVYRFGSHPAEAGSAGALPANAVLQAHTSITLPPGAGPRHLAFHPDGRSLYVLNELDSTIAVFSYEASQPAFTPLQSISSLPPGCTRPNTAAHIALHPGGRFLYASNRGDDSLAIFAVGPDGRLDSLGHIASGGRTPRHFALSPDGRFLVAANQDSDALVVFRVDPDSGWLEETGMRVEIPTPACVVIR